MGQQQLILLVLATVIVGLAIVVGIQAFTEGGQRANADAMMQDAVRIANDIQAWAKKPAPFGGPTGDSGDENFSDANFPKMGYPSVEGDNEVLFYRNLNGEYILEPGTGEILIRGQSLADDGTTVRNEVQVRVCGTTDRDILGAITIIGEQSTTNTPAACPN